MSETFTDLFALTDAAPAEPAGEYIQMVGRGLRQAPEVGGIQPASDKAVDFAVSLMLSKLGVTIDRATVAMFDRFTVSAMIDDLKRRADLPAAVLTPGVYQAGQDVYRVYPARADRTRMLAARWGVGGEFEYAGLASRFVSPLQRLDVATVARYGQEYGFCMVCGAELTDPNSVAAGIGPVCWSRY